MTIVHERERLDGWYVELRKLTTNVATADLEQIWDLSQFKVLELRVLNWKEVDVIGDVRDSFSVVLAVLFGYSGS